MPAFSDRFLDNSFEHWLIAGAIAVVTFIVLKIVVITVRKRLPKLASRTQTVLDDIIVEMLARTRFFFLAAIALVAGSEYLHTPSSTIQAIHIGFVLLALLQAGIWLNAALSFWLQRDMKLRMEADIASTTALGAMGFIARLIIWAVILLLALDNVGVNITALITGIGIGGIAIALALQKILEDIFSSLSIILDKPFLVGDYITIGDMAGTVERIGIKTTRVRSLSGEQLILSNSDLLTSRLRNFKRMAERRVQFSIRVPHDTPREALAALPGILREIVTRQSPTRFDRAHFKGIAESSLEFEIAYFVLTPDYNRFMDIQQAINLEILHQLDAQGIPLALPGQSLMLRQTKEKAQEDQRSNIKDQR